VGTVNVGFRAPAKPLFYMALREGGPTATNGMRPRSGRVSDRDPATGSDPEIIPGDHIPTRRTSPRWPSATSTGSPTSLLVPGGGPSWITSASPAGTSSPTSSTTTKVRSTASQGAGTCSAPPPRAPTPETCQRR
jgi:hypothetical protein